MAVCVQCGKYIWAAEGDPCICSCQKKPLTTKVEAKLIWSYLIYMILMLIWLVMIWGATGYIVFWLGHSGWWFVLTMCLSTPIMPDKWNAILTGVNTDED